MGPLVLTLVSVSGIITATNDKNPSGEHAKIVGQKTVVPKHIHDENGRKVVLLAYSPKHKLIASVPGLYGFKRGSTPSFPIYVWDLSSACLKSLLVGHSRPINSLAFMRDGGKLLSGAEDGHFLWNVFTGTNEKNRYFSVPGLAMLTPSGYELYQAKNNEIAVWEERTANKRRVLTASIDAKKGIRFANEVKTTISPDENLIALGGGLGNHSIVVWDFRNGTVKAVFSHEASLSNLLFSANGRYLFGGGNEIRKKYLGRGVLDIWDLQLGKLIQEIEVDDYEVLPIYYCTQRELVVTIDSLHAPEDGYNQRYRTFINGYSIKLGKRAFSFDTNLKRNGWCTSAIYMEDIGVICIGGADGTISFFSLTDILNKEK
jgi:WD40 repeat protein